MNDNRLADYLEHMQQAATDACSFTDGLGKDDFIEDKRTQQAVIMSLIIRGMRNRIAHGYFEINLDVVWETIQTALPELLKQLPAVRNYVSDK
jgi:uncharacterized protein with HEPN domain